MEAFGKPGIQPTWASSDKDLISTALGSSRTWLTLGYGILDEVFWPSTGEPQIRDLGFIVAKEGAWFEVKRVQRYTLSTPQPEIPLAQVVHQGQGYTLELEFLPDPSRDVILIRYRLEGQGFKLYPLLAPHLGSSGLGNAAWVGQDGLYAQKDWAALALTSQVSFLRASAGYVGASDGWQDFDQHGAMTWAFARAEAGNVALMGELPGGEGVLALGFAESAKGARTLAASSLAEGFGPIRERFIADWKDWASRLRISAPEPTLAKEGKISAMVLKVHEDTTYPGAVVASLSTPWGFAHDDPGGYHLVWPRDAAEAGLALLAAGQTEDARRMLAYLVATQQPDGQWAQNFFPDGSSYWQGVQLDEAAFPVLLACKLEEGGHLGNLQLPATTMVRKALAFIAQTGPSSPQDRWEENAGANPFTLAALIAALVAGAELGFLEEGDKHYALSLADSWNAQIEEWTYVTDTGLDHQYAIQGHYVRITPPGQTALRGELVVKNRQGEELPIRRLIGLEFLYLVRLGLRSADDPRIRDTLKLVDALLRVETPSGPFYHRYNEDGYGEHADGSPFDGSGIGRVWPLLAGERGHYALLAGEDPLPYLRAMAIATSIGGLIPEQVWDSDPIPEKGLYPGKPSGSAMPLVWAHAEFLKLLLAVQNHQPTEWLQAVANRYRQPTASEVWHWRTDGPVGQLPKVSTLLIEDPHPFTLRLGFDGWQGVHELEATPLGLGLYGVRLEAAALQGHATLEFTRRFGESWEGQNYQIVL
ncbi:MAG: glucan 1,4-alpha-glucosidase [Thermaceae bacterium]|nr:glucan 1,4-alpha-glucosidase [Thermaceae bacterium]